MSSESSMEMASQTISDASQLSLGAERGAENLMRDVSNARTDLGSNSRAFNDYDSMVSAHLEKNGTLPMLSLGHAKNSFDKLDLDGSGDLTKDELIIARDHAGSKVEERMLAMLSTNFQDVRSAHESNKYVPFMEDKKGITLDDLNAKLKEGESNMDQTDAREEQFQRSLVAYEIGNDLFANRGASFAKLARGEKGGNDQEITKDDLEDLLQRDDRVREFGGSALSPQERHAAEYLSKNWENPEVLIMRRDVVTYPDETGREQRDKGGMTLASIDKAMTGGSDLEKAAVQSLTEERLPDEGVLNQKDLSRLSHGGKQESWLAPEVIHDFAGDTKEILPKDKEDKWWLDPTKITIYSPETGVDPFEQLRRSHSENHANEHCNLPEWKVQKGEYLWQIAEQSLVDNGNCKPSSREINDMTNLIAKENNIHRNDYLKVGQRLRIPQTRNGKS